MSKIYHVEMKEPIDGKRHFYFGSQAAIYEVFRPSQVGIGYRSLTNTQDLSRQPSENRKCIIRMGELIRKKTGRGPKPQQFFHY